MTNTHGVRRGTRYMFSRAFKDKGRRPLKVVLATFKVGDIVDIKGTGDVQKGMPHKAYHGKTGIVYNVTKRAVGVVVNKRIKNRIVRKHINVRTEHVKQSKCRQDFLRRVKENDAKKAEASEKGVRGISVKREPAQPRSATFVNHSRNEPVVVRPLKFEYLA